MICPMSRSSCEITMTSEAAALFARVRAGILDTCPDVTEMPESRSVSYHDLFLEVSPAGATSP